VRHFILSRGRGLRRFRSEHPRRGSGQGEISGPGPVRTDREEITDPLLPCLPKAIRLREQSWSTGGRPLCGSIEGAYRHVTRHDRAAMVSATISPRSLRFSDKTTWSEAFLRCVLPAQGTWGTAPPGSGCRGTRRRRHQHQGRSRSTGTSSP